MHDIVVQMMMMMMKCMCLEVPMAHCDHLVMEDEILSYYNEIDGLNIPSKVVK